MSWDAVLGLGCREYKVFKERDDVTKIIKQTYINGVACDRCTKMCTILQYWNEYSAGMLLENGIKHKK